MKNLFENKPYRHYLLVGLLLVYQVTLAGQSDPPIDSLITRLPAMMRSDEARARQMVDELARRSVAEQHRHGLVQSLFFQAWLSYRHDPADVAIGKIDSALRHVEGIHADTAVVKFHILKGQCYVKKLQFASALQSFTEAMKIAENRNDHATRISTLISIGWAYMEDGKPAEAVRFFEEVLRVRPGTSTGRCSSATLRPATIRGVTSGRRSPMPGWASRLPAPGTAMRTWPTG